MAKRGNGEGSVYRRNDGKWVAAIPIPKHLGGKKKYHYGKTRKECVEWLENMRDSLKKGSYSENSDITLIEWLTTWLKDYCINIRPSTQMNYDTYINRHIASSEIAQMSICQLNTAVLQRFFNNLTLNGRVDGKGGLSAKTVRNLYNMLHQALKQAVGNQMIAKNPAEYVVLPKVTKPSIKALNMQEQQLLLNSCKGERWEIAVQISLWTGLRIGELLALRQSDFKVIDGIYYLDITKSLQRVKNYSGESNNTILNECDTKTENSVRQIPLSPYISDILAKHFAEQKAAADASFGLYSNDPYIVCNEIGNCIDPSTYRKWFKGITEKSGLSGKITPHTLRHTFASTALKYGVDLKSISDILGHYSTDFTARTYIHTDLNGKYEAMKAMYKMLEENERTDNNECKLLS